MKKHTKTMQAFVLVAVLSVSVMASARAELNNTWTTELGGWATISQGQSNGYVTAIQRFLYLYSLDTRAEIGGLSGIDGVFGSETKSAVILFQEDQGLTPDGLVGPKTWRKIAAYLTRSDRLTGSSAHGYNYGYNLYTDSISNGGISGNVIFAGFDSLSDEVADMYYYAYISAASLRVQPFKTP